MKTRDMTYIALMAVLISVCSWLSVPSVIPFTMQTFGIFCALLLLGGKRGSIAVLLYIVMGAVGLPVFSNFTGGVGKLMGPSGGYIFGFLLTALCYWAMTALLGEKPLIKILGLAAGLVLCYAFGTLWFVEVHSRSEPIGIISALSMCVFPFILPDAIKLALALAVEKLLKNRIKL